MSHQERQPGDENDTPKSLSTTCLSLVLITVDSIMLRSMHRSIAASVIINRGGALLPLRWRPQKREARPKGSNSVGHGEYRTDAVVYGACDDVRWMITCTQYESATHDTARSVRHNQLKVKFGASATGNDGPRVHISIAFNQNDVTPGASGVAPKLWTGNPLR
ncbi:hypothetical protein BKA82DRAFT_4020756 [Pisolithus tinctorius]|nr:hypothetical protein BKA82DRAFT_4020756 [Pisolithus tinctorius]